MDLRTRIAIGAALVAVAGGLLFFRSRDDRSSARDREPAAASSADHEPQAKAAASASAAPADDDASIEAPVEARADDASAHTLVRAKWGSGRGSLGHDVPQEGNPEGPMSLVATGKGLVVLDQVNGRLVHYDEDGRVTGTSEIPPTTQDVAVGKDGTVASLDRLANKTVTLTDARGRKIGELPLEGAVDDTGLVTGVFTDGDDVYAEKEHGTLVPIGTITGGPPGDAPELVGRPSKDGELLVSASLASGEMGRAVVNAFDRKKDGLRFTREVLFPRPAGTIVLLDTDARGTIYLGVTWSTRDVANVACLDPIDGHVVGRVALPISGTADESFRDFSVSPDGTIVWALRGEDGVDYRTARCSAAQ